MPVFNWQVLDIVYATVYGFCSIYLSTQQKQVILIVGMESLAVLGVKWGFYGSNEMRNKTEEAIGMV